MRSSKSRPPLAATAASYATNARATGPALVVGRHVRRRDAELDLEPRDRGVEPKQIGLVGPRRHRGQHRRTVGEGLDRDAGVAQDLAPECVEGPDADGSGLDPERFHGRIEPLGHLDRRSLVEGDRPDRVGRRARGDQPGGTRDEGRRLATPRRRDAQRRSGRRGRGGSLVGREATEAFHDRRMEGHRPIIGHVTHRPVIASGNAVHMTLTWCYRRSSTVVLRGPSGPRSERSATEQGRPPRPPAVLRRRPHAEESSEEIGWIG